MPWLLLQRLARHIFHRADRAPSRTAFSKHRLAHRVKPLTTSFDPQHREPPTSAVLRL